MKLLFCGPLEDFSGYAQFARNFAKTLHHGGVDLVCRSLKYDRRDNPDSFKLPDWLDECLKKPLEGIDVVLQNTTLNVEAQPVPGVMNGIYFFWETDRVPPQWAENANRFDFIIVPCEANAMALGVSGCTKPILVMPPPWDMSPYREEYPSFEIKNAGGRTVFYNICQLSSKKGIDALIRAYYAAFLDRPDEVLLVLKTYIDMANRQNDLRTIRGFIDEVRKGCRLPVAKYPPIYPMVEIIDDKDIHALHSTADCYVCSSRGEGFCIPAFEAMAHGTTVISNTWGGLSQFVNQNTALVYNGVMSHVFNMPHGDPMLYTGVERWFEPSTAEMCDLMRAFHLLRKGDKEGKLDPKNEGEWQKVVQRQFTGKAYVQKFDYKVMAPRLVGQLEAGFQSWKSGGDVEFDLEMASVKTMEIPS